MRLRRQAADEGLDPNKWFSNVELEVAKDIGEETVNVRRQHLQVHLAYKLAAKRTEQLKNAKAAGS